MSRKLALGQKEILTSLLKTTMKQILTHTIKATTNLPRKPRIVFYFLTIWPAIHTAIYSGGSRGGGSGPHMFLDQTRDDRHLPYPPPPPRLPEGLDPPLIYIA